MIKSHIFFLSTDIRICIISFLYIAYIAVSFDINAHLTDFVHNKFNVIYLLNLQ